MTIHARPATPNVPRPGAGRALHLPGRGAFTFGAMTMDNFTEQRNKAWQERRADETRAMLGRRLPVVLGGQGRSARSIRSDGWVLILWTLALVVLIVGFLMMR